MNLDYFKNVSDKAKKILAFPKTEEKVICFLPSWERYMFSVLQNDADYDNEDFIVNEHIIYNNIRAHYLKDGMLQYRAIQKFNDDYIDEKKLSKIVKSNPSTQEEEKILKDWKNKFFRNEKKRTLFDIKNKFNYLVERRIEVYPNDDIFKTILKKDELANFGIVNILCVDYKYFPYSIIKNYIKYYEILTRQKPNDVKDNLKPLFKLFGSSKADITLEIYPQIAKIIHKVYTNQFSVEEQDELEFLSSNHLQNIQLPVFWPDVVKKGYLCQYNLNDLDMASFKKTEKKYDIRFFYSFQSLLFYELKQMLTKVKRCKNCNHPLPQKHQGLYCNKGSNNYKECNKERNRNRQKRHYNLTKT